MTLADSQSLGRRLEFKEEVNISRRIGETTTDVSFKNLVGILSGPAAELDLSLSHNLIMPLRWNVIKRS